MKWIETVVVFRWTAWKAHLKVIKQHCSRRISLSDRTVVPVKRRLIKFNSQQYMVSRRSIDHVRTHAWRQVASHVSIILIFCQSFTVQRRRLTMSVSRLAKCVDWFCVRAESSGSVLTMHLKRVWVKLYCALWRFSSRRVVDWQLLSVRSTDVE